MAFMEKGRIVEDGNPREMLANPKTDRARQFLGSIGAAGRADGHRRDRELMVDDLRLLHRFFIEAVDTSGRSALSP
jgi:ABC-type proline/glycine betaine transport system ATPase subunit